MPEIRETLSSSSSSEDKEVKILKAKSKLDKKAEMEFEMKKFEIESNNRLRRDLAEMDLRRCEMEYKMKAELAKTEKEKLLIEVRYKLLNNLVVKAAESKSNPVGVVNKEESSAVAPGVAAVGAKETELVAKLEDVLSQQTKLLENYELQLKAKEEEGGDWIDLID